MDSTQNISQPRALVLDITSENIGYLTHGNGEAIASGKIKLDTHTGEYRKALENAVYDNAFLLEPYRSTAIALHSQHFQLLPQELIYAGLTNKVMEASFSKLQGEVLTCTVAGTDAGIACDVEDGVVGFLRRTFPGACILHHLASLCAYCVNAYKEDNACLHVCVDGKEAHIVVVRQGKLLMANTYHHRTPDDVIYFVLNVWKTCGLDSHRDKLMLTGDNNLRSTLATKLREWIACVMPEVMPAQALHLGRDIFSLPFNLIATALYENY